nr:reverse transcriptase domain-containing protein [Tanacetum cinerariifolium]
MPVELGSFDAIIGMDWLAKYKAIIVCVEKIVRIPWGNETLIIHATGGKKQYGGPKPLCAKCNYHHDDPCAPKCHKCNNIGHLARDCRVMVNTNNANNQRGTELGQKPTCYECGVKGHYKRDCPKQKNNNNQGNQGGRNNASARVYAVGRAGTDPDANVVTDDDGQILSSKRDQETRNETLEAEGQKLGCYECGVQGHFRRECPKLKNNNNHGNQRGRNNALARVYAVGHLGTDPDANVVTGTFLLNNRYASILFDTGADRSFVSTTFRTQINITPSTLDHCYDVESADGRIIGLNTIVRGCTLNLLSHPFNIDLMPVELDFLNTSESSNDDCNVVNTLQDPVVFNQDPDENSSQIPSHIDHHCCYGCGDSLDEPCHDQNVDEFPQTLPSFHSTCYPGDENSFAYDLTLDCVNDSSNIFNPPSQPPMYSYEFCGNDAQYGHDSPPQVLFIYNPKPSAKKQRSVVMSSAEAEYVVAAGCCAQVLWIKTQLADYDVLYDKVPIFGDNTSAIVISNNLVLHSRTNHIDISGLKYSEKYLPLPPKETVRISLATLRLVDEKDTSISSTDLDNSSSLRTRYFSPIWRVLMVYIVKCLGAVVIQEKGESNGY